MDVVCVGDCGIDRYLPAGDIRVGGITANFARHARRVFMPGDDVRIVSCVGDDPGATLVLSSLDDRGIDCHIRQLPGETPVQLIEIDEAGERKFVGYNEGVLRDFHLGSAEQRLLANCDLLVAPVYLQIVDLFDELMAVDTGAKIAIDFADFLQHPDFSLLERHIDRIDIGFFGLSVADKDNISRIADLARANDKLFVVTLGAEGSRAYHAGEQVDCPAEKVSQVFDTTGAGDAFAAGFLGRHCRGASLQEAMASGAALAAQVVGHCGSYLQPGSSDPQ